MKFPTEDEWVKTIGEKVLNDYIIDGKPLKEWIDIMSKTEIKHTTGWIPCSERLPELHECKKYDMESSDYVLVYGITKDGESGVAISCYSKNYEGEGWCDAYIYIEFGQLEKIIAWMPLPEPYKAE